MDDERRRGVPPDASSAWAYFLDFDGTLVDIAERPEAVQVLPALRMTLGTLSAATAGAVALVTGRRIEDLDALLHPLRLPAAGLHGGELRLAAEAPIERSGADTLSAPERAALAELQARHARVLVEDKGAAVALHYRGAPSAAGDCLALATRLVAAAPRRRGLQRGKMVAEVKLVQGDKGEVVRRFLQTPRFAGRRPVFLGDDVTDEAGFAAVLALDGLAIRVGDGATLAPHHLPDPAAALSWLAGAVGR
ncbi:MAG TPA: trehalose-phosphatase [Kiloniellales bacterium]|nr:trehalose-phosphatase [Kiloniellales bacterium]